ALAVVLGTELHDFLDEGLLLDHSTVGVSLLRAVGLVSTVAVAAVGRHGDTELLEGRMNKKEGSSWRFS
ncbi:hypothetical protein CGJ07_24980, partial [Vibrio parahaemolyticus]